MKEYPHTKSKKGIGNLVLLLRSFPQSVYMYCMHDQAIACSGIICKQAIATKTPPLKALAMPSTIGLSVKDLDLTGIKPDSAASKKAIIINTNLRVSADHII